MSLEPYLIFSGDKNKMTPNLRAKKVAEIMWEKDYASQDIGIEMQEIGPGFSRLSLIVEKKHLNGHGICHGGIIFTLADTAFAFACNSYNQLAVSQNNCISYILPGKLNQNLIATAEEASRVGKTGIYLVRVSNPDGQMIAFFKGSSRTITGKHFDES